MEKIYDVFYIKIGDYETPYIYIDNMKYFLVKEFFANILDIKVFSTYLRDRGFNDSVPGVIVKFIDGKEKFTYVVSEKKIPYILKKYESQYLLEEQGERLDKAALHFGIDRSVKIKNKTIEIVSFNKKDVDDIWGNICYKQYKKKYEAMSFWKECQICKKSFPIIDIFFRRLDKKENFSNCCLKCLGENYKCLNKYIKTLFDIGGEELIKYFKNSNIILFYKYIKKNNLDIKIDLSYFSEISIIRFIDYLSKIRFTSSKSNYYSDLYKIVKKPNKEILALIREKKKKYNPNKPKVKIQYEKINRIELKKIIKKNFPVYIPYQIPKKSGFKCLYGFMNKGKLYYVVDKIIDNKIPNQIVFTKKKELMIKKIERIKKNLLL